MTPLHQFGDLIREQLLRVPLPAARALFVAVPLLLMVWVLLLPRERTKPPGGTGRWDENLKLGACFALALQTLIYLLL